MKQHHDRLVLYLFAVVDSTRRILVTSKFLWIFFAGIPLWTVSPFLFRQMTSSNILITLGRVGCTLSDTPGAASAALALLQQKLCKPPSSFDTLIVEQMIQMAVKAEVSPISHFQQRYL